MRVDWQTLQDLGILRPEGYQASLFDWANFTRTAGGGLVLKERFRRPLSNSEALSDVQSAVEWLTGHATHFDALLGGSAWQTVEQYVQSSFTALDHPNRVFLWLDSWWIRHWRSDLFREVSASLSVAQTLSRHAAAIAAALESLKPPRLVTLWHGELRQCLEDPAVVPLLTSRDVQRLWPPQVLRLDYDLRRREFEPLKRLAALVYRIDALRSLALATVQRGLVFPEIVWDAQPTVEGEGLYHPLVEHPIDNALTITRDGRLVFLTGPNMAGKSTYLKAAGIAVYLAHLGMGVPARRFRFSPFDCLFSGINTTDNLRLGQSYFYREVRRVREITDILSEGSSAFVLFDEMFKGTNLKDASDACLAVLSGFAACQRSVFVVASHLAELATAIEKLDDVQFLQFGARIQDQQPVFDYRIREGVSEQRLGMLILEREGVLKRLQQLRSSSLQA